MKQLMKAKITRAIMTIALFASLALPVETFSQEGSLDLTFDTDGKVTTGIGLNGDEVGNSVAIQNNGKIVVAGYSYNGANQDFAVVRYNTDGSLDLTFDTDGKVTTDIGNLNDLGKSVAIQTDDKIVVAGYGRIGNNNDIVVVRYNSDGSLDNTLDTDGIVTTAIGNSNDYGFDVAIQTDGKILVTGSRSPSNVVVVVRYNTDGSLDNSFDLDGVVTTAIGSSAEGLSIALQSDDKILVAGYRSQNGYNDIAVVRYNTDGSLDITFDSDGVVTTDIGGLNDIGYDIAIQSDDKIVVAGIGYNNLDSDFAAVRYNTDGSLDLTFDADGIVTFDNASYIESARSVALQIDGKIVVAGLSTVGSASFVVVIRFNSNGSLDNNFNNDGIVATTIGASSEGQSIALQSDGKIVVAGYGLIGSNLDFAVARYHNTNTTGINTIYSPTAEIKIRPNPFTSQTTLQTNNNLKNATLKSL